MLNKIIEIAGKKAYAGYCYATEIAYKDLAKQDINDFIVEVQEAYDNKKLPDIKKAVYLILSSMMSYYQSIGEDSPIKDNDIMYGSTSAELVSALATVITLRTEFYHIPEGEPEEKKGNEGKNS